MAVHDYQEMLRDVTADVLARYEDDYLAGLPAITCNSYGDGHAYYVACRTEQSQIEFLYRDMLERAHIPYKKLPAGIEKHTRYKDDITYDFYMNCTSEANTVTGISGFNLLNSTEVLDTLTLNPYEVAVLKS